MRRRVVAEPVLWVLLGCILACAPLLLRDLAAQDPPGSVLWPSLLAGSLQAAAFCLLVQLFRAGSGRGAGSRRGAVRPAGRRAVPQPAALGLLAFAWGLCVVPVVASFANTHYFGILNGFGLHAFAASIAAPVDEDLLRFIGVLGVLTLASTGRRRISILDGIVYGFLVGAGFETAENLAFLLGSEDLNGTLQLALIRLGIGFGLHALWTGIVGAGLACAMVRRRDGLPARWWAAGLALLGPMLLHALWDAPAPSVAPLAVFSLLGVAYGLTLAAFGTLLVLARRGEAPMRRKRPLPG